MRGHRRAGEAGRTGSILLVPKGQGRSVTSVPAGSLGSDGGHPRRAAGFRPGSSEVREDSRRAAPRGRLQEHPPRGVAWRPGRWSKAAQANAALGSWGRPSAAEAGPLRARRSPQLSPGPPPGAAAAPPPRPLLAFLLLLEAAVPASHAGKWEPRVLPPRDGPDAAGVPRRGSQDDAVERARRASRSALAAPSDRGGLRRPARATGPRSPAFGARGWSRLCKCRAVPVRGDASPGPLERPGGAAAASGSRPASPRGLGAPRPAAPAETRQSRGQPGASAARPRPPPEEAASHPRGRPARPGPPSSRAARDLHQAPWGR